MEQDPFTLCESYAGKTTRIPERSADDKETCRLRLNANYPELPRTTTISRFEQLRSPKIESISLHQKAPLHHGARSVMSPVAIGAGRKTGAYSHMLPLYY